MYRQSETKRERGHRGGGWAQPAEKPREAAAPRMALAGLGAPAQPDIPWYRHQPQKPALSCPTAPSRSWKFARSSNVTAC